MSSSTADGTRYYVYDGDLVIGEVLYTGSGYVPAVAYTWGANGLVSERFLIGTAYSLWYHFGPQGETRYLTNMPVPPNPAAIVDSYLYTAYGEPVASTGTDRNPFRYGGQVGYYTGPGAGIVLCGVRWYNPYTARWMTRDPIGYAGGADLYAYCGESPLYWSDPSGELDLGIIRGGDGKAVSGGCGKAPSAAHEAWRWGIDESDGASKKAKSAASWARDRIQDLWDFGEGDVVGAIEGVGPVLSWAGAGISAYFTIQREGYGNADKFKRLRREQPSSAYGLRPDITNYRRPQWEIDPVRDYRPQYRSAPNLFPDRWKWAGPRPVGR